MGYNTANLITNSFSSFFIIILLSFCQTAEIPMFGFEDGFGSEGAYSLPPTEITTFSTPTIDVSIVFETAMSQTPIVLSAVRSLSWSG